MQRFRTVSAALAALLAASVGGRALAWGATGHRLIGALAVEALPAGLPDFVRSADAGFTIDEYAREPDRWKGAGRAHDSDLNPAHFVDVGDDGKVLGGPALAALPETRALYETGLRAVGTDSWKAGYLPYSITESWQQLANDFAFWRVEQAALAHVADAGHLQWFRNDMAARQSLILRDIGVLAHYVGDGSQPLHVTVHFDGWGPSPNPEGFTNNRIHAPFEGSFVHDNADVAEARGMMAPYRACGCAIAEWTRRYLSATAGQVAPLYRLWKGRAFRGSDPLGRAFVDMRLAAGASALRDAVADAWAASESQKVGWPAPVNLAQVQAGLDPYDSLYGTD
ncbi:MAG TPA: S1/P1 Nuclease [Caulobacteraceae bacterium]|jgi:hypothetical protein|nr:S1/P1 Nuclease [Caulobacteraceae bacterium]